MALYVLDTSSLTHIRWGQANIMSQMAAHGGDEIAITSTIVEEALGGWQARLRQARTNAEQAKAAKLLADAFMFLAPFPVHPVTQTSLNRFDSLVKQRLNVGRMDLKIASLALELGATVVTSNLRDFSRIPGLQIEDWAA